MDEELNEMEDELVSDFHLWKKLQKNMVALFLFRAIEIKALSLK